MVLIIALVTTVLWATVSTVPTLMNVIWSLITVTRMLTVQIHSADLTVPVLMVTMEMELTVLISMSVSKKLMNVTMKLSVRTLLEVIIALALTDLRYLKVEQINNVIFKALRTHKEVNNERGYQYRTRTKVRLGTELALYYLAASDNRSICISKKIQDRNFDYFLN